MAVEDRLADRGVTILVNLYTGILRGLPNLFDILEDSKQASYHHDYLVNDISQTGNATLVTLDDGSYAAFMKKLNENSVIFDMVPSSCLPEDVEQIGSYAFVLREKDYSLALMFRDDVVAELTQTPEKEEDDLERERGEEAQEEDQEEEAEVQEETEEEEKEEEEEGPDEKKKKDKSSKHKTSSVQKNDSSLYDHDEADRIRKEDEARRAKEDEQRRTDERRLDDDRQRQERERQREESVKRQEAETQRKSDEDRRQADNDRRKADEEQKRRQGEEDKSRLKEQDDTQRKDYDTRKEERQKEERRTDERKDHEAKRRESGAANRDKSVDFGSHQIDKGKSTEEVIREESWIGGTKKGGTGGDTHTGDSRASGAASVHIEERRAESRVDDGATRETEAVDKPENYRSDSQKPEAARDREQGRGPAGSETSRAERQREERRQHEETKKEETKKDRKEPSSDKKTDSRPAGGTSRSESYHAERKGLAQGGRDVSADFSGHRGAAKQESSVECLGTGATISGGAKTESSNSARFGGSRAMAGTGSRQGEILGGVRSTPGGGEVRGQEEAAENGNGASEGRSGTGERTKATGSRPSIEVRKIDLDRLTKTNINNINNNNESAVDIRPNFSDQLFRDFRDIQTKRALYHARDVFNPKNFKAVGRQSRNMVAQTVVSRDTEAGQVANEIVDYTSPVARALKTNFLHSGAVCLAKGTHCDIDILKAAYSAQNGITLAEADVLFENLKRQDIKLIGENGIGVTLADDARLAAQLNSVSNIQGDPAGFIELLGRMDETKFNDFISKAGITEDLKKSLMSVPKSDIDSIKIQGLLRKHGNNAKDKAFLEMMYTAKIKEQFGSMASMMRIGRGYIVKLFKSLGRGSDAGKALNDLYGGWNTFYGTYRAGVSLMMNIANKFHLQVPGRLGYVIRDPAGAALNKAAGMAGKKAANSKLAKSASKIGGRAVGAVKHTRTAQHGASALKFLSGKLASSKSALMNTRVMKQLSKLVSKLSSAGRKAVAGLTKAAAAIGSFLGWVVVIVIIIIILSMAMQSIKEKTSKNSPKNYPFVQDTEIVQEVIDELTAKNEAFITEINNAANHRGQYAGNVGYDADQEVGFYESYSVVFIDTQLDPDGNPIELDPSHVDLNNTKAILSMATKFMPYPFQKPGSNASEEEKQVYEELKQHFKDYCNFLWAATHQISIQEYQPSNPEYSEYDNSALQTTMEGRKYVCDKNGTTVWRLGNTEMDRDYQSGQACEDCSEEIYTGYGTYLDDLCNHGQYNNEHGGWKKTGRTATHVNCPTNHHCGYCSDDENSVSHHCREDCGKLFNKNHEHVAYEWVYECGGHMGAVVYVTIGDLSRMPGFPEAGDVDYDTVGKYDTGMSITGDSLIGATSFNGKGYTLTDEQIRWITACCIEENGTNPRAISFEASLVGNLTDMGHWGHDPYTVINSKWFASSTRNRARNSQKNVTEEQMNIVRDVLCNGNRTTKANEHDCFPDIKKIVTDGTVYTAQADIKKRSNYVPGVTIIYNKYGSVYRFECFPSDHSDPFGVIID